MGFFERYFPRFVSALGSLGLGLAGAYLFGVGLLFAPGFDKWVEFFLVWGPPLVVLPGGMLMAHLYLRTHLARWLVERGRDREALEYTEDRLDPNLSRNRKEALYHRIYRARTRVYRGEYEEALELLSRGYSVPREGEEGLLVCRWRLEAALRLEWAEAVAEAIDDVEIDSGRAKTRAAVRGCLAEWSALADEREDFQDQLEEGGWASEGHWRLAWAEAVGLGRHDWSDPDGERLGECLKACRDTLIGQIPGCQGEWAALKALRLKKMGRGEAAAKVASDIEDQSCDGRSRGRVQEIRKSLSARKQ